MNAVRRLFGPSKAEIWRHLSTELGARYDAGGFLTSDMVRVAHGEWTLTLDIYVVTTGTVTVPYTRLRAPYVNPDGFRFVIYRRGFFSDIAKRFGMQDVEVGHAQFDRDFIIKGTDGPKLRALFANPKIRELIEGQPEISFAVKDDEGMFGASFPAGVDELYFLVGGVIKDIGRLKHLFELFAETLDELCRLGSAYEGAPPMEGRG